MLRCFLAAIALVLLGCHGTELQVGAGRTFNDFSGRGSSGGSFDDGGKHGATNFSDFDFDQDDSWSLWAQLAFQLTPQSIVLKQSAPGGGLSMPRYRDLLPWSPVGVAYAEELDTAAQDPTLGGTQVERSPVSSPAVDLTPVLERLAELEARPPPAPPNIPVDLMPVHESLAAITETLSELGERMAAMEAETGNHISWSDIGLGGAKAGGGLGTLGLLAWAVITYLRRRNGGGATPTPAASE